MCGSTLEINGKTYVPLDDSDSKNCIVVCDRGYVLYGSVSLKDNYLTIRDCQCIRYWGTTRGLGELAQSGPTSKTKLDPQPTTRVHELQVVQIIECEGEKWTQ